MMPKNREEAIAFLRKVLGPPMRKITGKEYDQTMVLLALVGPYKETNNQRSMTEYYSLAGKEYRLHFFEGETELEVIEDDIQQN